MATSKNDLVSQMPREQLEAIVVAAQEAYGDMKGKLDAEKIDARNWHIAADGYAGDAKRYNEEAQLYFNWGMLATGAFLITLTCLLLLIFGVI